MKHQINFRKLGRTAEHRWAMLRNQVTSLIEHERIKTTVPKAKELRRVADWMVTLGKRGDDLHAIRLSRRVLRDIKSMQKLFHEIAPRYKNRPGGYTRILKIGNRRGDAAKMCIIEFVDREGELRKAKTVTEDTVLRNTTPKLGDASKVSKVLTPKQLQKFSPQSLLSKSAKRKEKEQKGKAMEEKQDDGNMAKISQATDQVETDDAESKKEEETPEQDNKDDQDQKSRKP